ncbi:MAG: phosphoribosylformylglycinamidine synthase subunit PurS [Pseudanabaenaceae cyanobacterium]
MQYHAQVFITLRPAVLDPAGTAVQSALQGMNYSVNKVRIGKYIELNLTADSEPEAVSQLDRICAEVLANPVIETYKFVLQAVE